ncbi:MAG: hypothetical protein HUU35_20085, partial [Armatimonadetes bacterium]|nr:hypothetical protein [Armatimonadota bacterium]
SALLAARFAQPDHRQALVTGTGGPTTPLIQEGNRPLSLIAHHPERTGVRAVQLTLALGPAERDDVIELAVKQNAELDLNLPWAELTDRGEKRAAEYSPRHHRDICRVYTQRAANNAGPLTVAFDLPDLVLEAGEGLVLEVRCPTPLRIDPTRSSLRLETCAPQAARPEYLPRLERLMRLLYSAETEAHPYGSKPYQDMVINRYVQRVLAEDPANPAANAILCRIAARLPLVSIERPGPASAPDWAVWGRHAQREWYRVAAWWLENRWVPYGEIGGNLNDDVEYTCHWPLAYLITGDDRLRAALGTIADAIWEQSGGSGYSIAATDVEHAAEDSSCSLPQMLLCEYASPLHIERMMRMSEHIPTWTGINSKGRRQFKSYMFNAKMVSQKPKEDVDHLYCALAMVGPTHLSWYNRHPLTTQWTTEYATAWAEAGMSTAKGKPAGALPCDIRYSDSEIFPYTERYNQSVYYSFGDYVMKNLLLGAQRLGLPSGEALPAICGVIEGTPQASVDRATKALETFANPPAAEPGKS